ncbi:MAG: ComEC/Rec2 family competence protein [Candidatus Bipolaricaulota bacterium]
MPRVLLPGVAAGLTFGAALGAAGAGGWWVVPVGAVLLAGACWRRSCALLWAVALVGGLALPQPEESPSQFLYQLPLMQEATVRVVGIPEPRSRSTEALVELEGHPTPLRLVAYLPAGSAVGPGDLLHLEGRGAQPRPAEWETYLRRRGVFGLFLAESAEVLEQGGPGLLRWAHEARMRLLHRLTGSLPEEGAAFLSALLLGARGLMPDERQDAFRAAGVAHLLALSGLHLGLLVAGGWLLLKLFRLPPVVRYLMLMLFVSCYVLVGGARVSLIRAAIMFGCAGSFWILWHRGWVLRRWLDPLQALAAAAVVVVLIWPWSPADAAFQLSFMATGAILLLLPGWMSGWLRAELPRWLLRPADLLAVTACAQAGALPVIGATFGHVALFGLMANLLLVTWTAVLLWSGVVVLLLGPVAGTAVDRFLIAPYLAVVERLASFPGSELPVGPGFGLWCAVAALGVLILWTALREEGDALRRPA